MRNNGPASQKDLNNEQYHAKVTDTDTLLHKKNLLPESCKVFS